VKPPSDVIFANPIKTIPQLKFVRSIRVDIMTFDNKDELLKIANYFPSARLILRIRVEDSNSIQPFKDKYGCQMSNVRTLLGIAKDLQLNVVGVSFHVGCRASDATAYAKAISDSYQVFNIAKSEFNYEFQILNIGGMLLKLNKHYYYY